LSETKLKKKNTPPPYAQIFRLQTEKKPKAGEIRGVGGKTLLARRGREHPLRKKRKKKSREMKNEAIRRGEPKGVKGKGVKR